MTLSQVRAVLHSSTERIGLHSSLSIKHASADPGVAGPRLAVFLPRFITTPPRGVGSPTFDPKGNTVTMNGEHAQTDRAEQFAMGLGWFSLALGMAEIAAPRGVVRMAGLPDDRRTTNIVRAFGAREIGHGVAILSNPTLPAAVWSRVAGDVLDIACLGAGLRSDDADRRRGMVALAGLVGATAADVMCAQRLSRRREASDAFPRYHVDVRQSTTINRPIEQVYEFWKDFSNFPRFMRHLESVEMLGEGRSRWRATGPGGITVEWEADTIEDRENELISWRSREGSTIENRGTVRFRRAPGVRGTELRVDLEYRPPAGALGRSVAWLFGKAPEQQISEDLRRVKQLLETGQITLSEGPGLWRAAQPAADPEQIRSLAGVHQ